MDKPKRKRPRKGTANPRPCIVIEDEGMETFSPTPQHYQTYVSPLQQTNIGDPGFQQNPGSQVLPSPNSRRAKKSPGSDDDSSEIPLPRPLIQIANDLLFLSQAQKELQRKTELTAHEIYKNKDCMMADVAQSIIQYIHQLMVEGEDVIEKSHTLLRVVLLYGHQIDFLRIQVLRNLYRLIVQCDIYREEVNSLLARTTEIPARLFVESNFVPVLKVNEKCGAVEVRLLTGACLSPKLIGFIKADLVPHVYSSKIKDRGEKVRDPLSGREAPVVFGVASFEGLRITTATGNRGHHLCFSVVVQQEDGEPPVTIKSPLSEHLVVMTNISQWTEIEHVLFQNELFRHPRKPLEPDIPPGKFGAKLELPHQETSITPAFFCNTLSRRFLLATKQDPTSQERQIMDSELQFLLKRSGPLSPNGSFTTQNYAVFWEWYGSVVQLIKYHRFMLVMWLKGLLWGFIPKRDAEFFLSGPNVPVGTFIIRFSEANPGSLAIAYKQNPGRIRHYLLKNPDWKAGSSLPQFLRETPSFQFFFKLSSLPNTAPSFNIVPKEEGLFEIDQRPKRDKTIHQKNLADYDTEVQHLEQTFQSMGIDQRQSGACLVDDAFGMDQVDMDPMLAPGLDEFGVEQLDIHQVQPQTHPMSPISPMSPSIMNPMQQQPISPLSPMSPSLNHLQQPMNGVTPSMQMAHSSVLNPMNSMQGQQGSLPPLSSFKQINSHYAMNQHSLHPMQQQPMDTVPMMNQHSLNPMFDQQSMNYSSIYHPPSMSPPPSGISPVQQRASRTNQMHSLNTHGTHGQQMNHPVLSQQQHSMNSIQNSNLMNSGFMHQNGIASSSSMQQQSISSSSMIHQQHHGSSMTQQQSISSSSSFHSMRNSTSPPPPRANHSLDSNKPTLSTPVIDPMSQQLQLTSLQLQIQQQQAALQQQAILLQQQQVALDSVKQHQHAFAQQTQNQNQHQQSTQATSSPGLDMNDYEIIDASRFSDFL